MYILTHMNAYTCIISFVCTRVRACVCMCMCECVRVYVTHTPQNICKYLSCNRIILQKLLKACFDALTRTLLLKLMMLALNYLVNW